MDFVAAFMLIIGAGFTITTSRILVKLARMDKKADDRHEANVQRDVLQSRLRSDEEVVVLELVSAVQNKKCNGELEDATKQFKESRRVYEAFVCTQASTRLAENK